MTLDRLTDMLAATRPADLSAARPNWLCPKDRPHHAWLCSQHALEVLGAPYPAVLVTTGPAGIQVGEIDSDLVDRPVW